MHWFVHGSVGMLTANLCADHPGVAMGVSFTSHYLLDLIPHRDPGIPYETARWRSQETHSFLTVILPDVVATVCLGVLLPALVPGMPWALTAGCVLCAVLPDIIDGSAKLTNWPWLQLHRRFHDWAHYDHYRRPVLWWLNIIIQSSLFVAASVSLYLVLRSNGHLAGL